MMTEGEEAGEDALAAGREYGRRDFHALSLAALAGALAGSSLSSCGNLRDRLAMRSPVELPEDILLAEPHVCRGLNTCKGLGAGGGNRCAGAGQCATARSHSCHGQNDCRGQGGCGETAGRNQCAGQGGCAVPLDPEVWEGVRAAFEVAASSVGMRLSPAPPA